MICRNLSLVDFIVIVGDLKFNFLRFIEFCVFVNISLRLIYFIIFLKFFRSIGSIMIRFLHFFFYLQIFVRADSCLFHFIMFILCFWDIRFFSFKFFEFLVFMNANLCIPDTLVFVLIFGVYKSAVVTSWILCRRGAIFVNGIPRLKVSKKTVNVKLQ